MVTPETAIIVDVNVEVRDPGHVVWSCHTAEIKCLLGDFQALLVGLGHSDLYEEAQVLVEALDRGDLSYSGDLILEEEDNRNVSIQLLLDTEQA